jgi:hypothetical protein
MKFELVNGLVVKITTVSDLPVFNLLSDVIGDIVTGGIKNVLMISIRKFES